jgi:hypothetical protein
MINTGKIMVSMNWCEYLGGETLDSLFFFNHVVNVY